IVYAVRGQAFAIDLEATEIVGKDQQAVGGQQRHRKLDQSHVIALHIEGGAHALGVGERGRIEEYQVELASGGALGSVLQPAQAVGLDQFVLATTAAVQLKIARCPVQVSS